MKNHATTPFRKPCLYGTIGMAFTISSAALYAAIASLIAATEDTDPLDSTGATAGPISIPGAALGQEVHLAWRFTGDRLDVYSGADIDDILLTAPAP